MPSPKFPDLHSLFERKAALFRGLKKYIKPIHEFARDAGLAELRQEEEHVFLEQHYFGSDKGLFPIVEGLISVNDEILSYENPGFAGQRKDKYDKMLESVRKEQYFLKEFFRKTLEDVLKHKGYKEYWNKSFSSYEKFLNRVRLSLTYLSWLLHIEAATVVNNILNLISQAKLDEVIAFIENEESAKLLSNDEVDFFRKLIDAVKEQRYDEIEAILEEGKNLIENEEYGVLMWVFNLDIEIVSINSEEVKESIEIKAGDEIAIVANVKCGFVSTGCKAFLRIPEGIGDKPWAKESLLHTIDRSKRTRTLQYEGRFEFKFETSDLIPVLNETANGHVYIVAQSQLCKKVKTFAVKIAPDTVERLRREMHTGPITPDKIPTFERRKRFRIDDEPVRRTPAPPTQPTGIELKFALDAMTIYRSWLDAQRYTQSQFPYIFLELDHARSNFGGLGNPLFIFSQTDRDIAPFVAIIKQNGTEGVMFPSPIVEYMDVINLIFNSVKRENAQQAKRHISLIPIIKIGDRLWQILKIEPQPPAHRPVVQLPPEAFAELERVGFQILDLIEPQGRRAPLASLPNLQEWLTQHHPRIEANPVAELNRNIWRLVFLTPDGQNGIVIPILDSLVGLGDALKWFESYGERQYDGTQALVRVNVIKFAKAKFEEERGEVKTFRKPIYPQGPPPTHALLAPEPIGYEEKPELVITPAQWICIEKGKINLDVAHRDKPTAAAENLTARKEITEIQEKSKAYLRIVKELLGKIRTQQIIDGIILRMKGWFEKRIDIAQELLDGRIPIIELRKVLNVSQETFKSESVILVDAIFDEYDTTKPRGIPGNFFDERPDLKLIVEELLRLGAIEIILPRLGTSIDQQRHEYNPVGVNSQYRENTVAQVLKPGYMSGKTLYRRARVEKSTKEGY